MEMAYKDITHKRFGRLIALKRVDIPGNRTKWLCKCDCGNKKLLPLDSLTSGRGKSCGCIRKENTSKLRKKHGYSRKTRLYNTWLNMRNRCNNPKSKSYKYYGGRGISVCEEWEDFASFKSWAENNGYHSELTIDRIDVNGNYEPSNCKWSTKKEQANNTRKNVKTEIEGVIRTLAEHAEFYGVNYDALHYRYEVGKRDTDLLKTNKQKLIIEMNGEKLNLKEWSKRMNINYGTLQHRYNSGLRGEDLFKPVNKVMSEKAKKSFRGKKIC